MNGAILTLVTSVLTVISCESRVTWERSAESCRATCETKKSSNALASNKLAQNCIKLKFLFTEITGELAVAAEGLSDCENDKHDESRKRK
jgi:hypothetical protein